MMKSWLAVLMIGICMATLQIAGCFEPVEDKIRLLADLMTPLHFTPVTCISISDLSEESWPFTRLDQALVLRGIARYNPKTVGFEVPFYGSDTFYASYDRQLSKACSLFDQVVFGVGLYEADQTDSLPDDTDEIPYDGDINSLPDYQQGFWPNIELQRNGAASPMNFQTDSDGVVRSARLIYRIGQHILPSFALQIYGAYRDVDWMRSRVHIGRDIVLKNDRGQRVGVIIIDDEGNVPIRYRRLSGANVEFWTSLLASEQMLQGQKPAYDLNKLRNQCILIGRENPKIVKKLKTPVGELYPVQIQQHILENLIQQRVPQNPSPLLIDIGMLLIVAIFSSVARLPKLPRRIIWISMLLGWPILAIMVYIKLNWIVPIFSVIFTALSSLFIIQLSQWWKGLWHPIEQHLNN